MAKSNEVFSITALITNGVSKKESPIKLDDELSKLWDEIAVEVADMKARGIMVEIPFEMPDVEVPARDYKQVVPKYLDRDEIKTFIKFLNKTPNRPFEFVYVPEVYGEVLNKFIQAGDYDSARLYAERYLQ